VVRSVSVTTDLVTAIQNSDVIHGQSFTIRQRFTGALDNLEVTSVTATVTDGDGATVSAGTGPVCLTAAFSSLYARGGTSLLELPLLQLAQPVRPSVDRNRTPKPNDLRKPR
jgi:hypothetical protein